MTTKPITTVFFVTWFIIIINICNGNDLYYRKKEEAKSTDVICPDTDICNIHVTAERACQQSTIYCTPNDDCYINCNGKKSCYQSIINCPSSGNCIIKCDGDNSCRYSTINGPTSGKLLKIHCDGSEGCDDSNINAFNNIDGILELYSNENQKYGLHKANIQCPPNGDCILKTFGYHALHESIINATSSKLLTINTSGKVALCKAKIYCPSDGMANSEQTCIVEVDDASEILYQTEFYAVESFKDIKIICNGNKCAKNVADGGFYSPKLFCKAEYEANCRLKVNENNNILLCGTPSHCESWTLQQNEDTDTHKMLKSKNEL